VVVDRKVQVLPAGAPGAMRPLAEDRLADCPGAAEALDVDADELAGPLALVALDRRARWQPQSRAPVTARQLPHRRGWAAEQGADDHRSRVRAGTRREDLRRGLGRAAPRLPAGHRRTVEQRRPAALLEAAPEPVAGRAAGAAGGRGRRRARTGADKRNQATARLE